MRTFSEIVDLLADESYISGDRGITQLAIYVQNTISAANLDNSSSAWDSVELNIPITHLDGGRKFNLPADYLNGLEVRYDLLPSAIPQKKLGKVAPAGDRYWYRAGRYIVFSGHILNSVQLAYSRLTPVFSYYPMEMRLLRSSDNPMTIFDWRPDPDADWQPFNQDDSRQMQSYYRHTNWLIERWGSTVLTGAKSFALNDAGNLEAGARAYNAFTTALSGIRNIE